MYLRPPALGDRDVDPVARACPTGPDPDTDADHSTTAPSDYDDDWSDTPTPSDADSDDAPAPDYNPNTILADTQAMLKLMVCTWGAHPKSFPWSRRWQSR